MSWPCYFLENPPLASYELDGKHYFYVDTRELKVGAMWYARNNEGEVVSEAWRRKMHLSAHYWANNAHRPPLLVALPCNYSSGPGLQVFSIDSQCYERERGYYEGWSVDGEPPRITVAPSINIVGSYHGYLREGVVSDDVEGRTFGSL